MPGCWSHGADEDEAIESVKDAIHESIEVVFEPLKSEHFREIEVTVQAVRKIPGISHVEAIRAVNLPDTNGDPIHARLLLR